MTRDEVIDWLETRTFEEVIDYIITADDWECSSPEFYTLDAHAILDNDGNLYIIFEEPMNMIIGTVNPLQYRWKLPDLVFEEFYVEEKRKAWPWMAVGGGGMLAGIIIGLLVN